MLLNNLPPIKGWKIILGKGKLKLNISYIIYIIIYIKYVIYIRPTSNNPLVVNTEYVSTHSTIHVWLPLENFD